MSHVGVELHSLVELLTRQLSRMRYGAGTLQVCLVGKSFYTARTSVRIEVLFFTLSDAEL